MKKAVIIRLNADDKQTLGRFYLYNGVDELFNCKSLELPFKANIKNLSCIPPGFYKVKARNSKKYGDHYIVENVEFRSFILIHVANFYTDLRGCIGLGKTFANINDDDITDITNSRKTLNKLLEFAPDGFNLIILDNL